MVIIGDVHGLVKHYKKITDNVKESIQVGDFGFFRQHKWMLDDIDYEAHKICFGNHDYYPYLHEKHSMGDWNYNSNTGLMTIRGAYSIDQSIRHIDIDYFDNEEMDYHEWSRCIKDFKKNKPSIVVSHECPQVVRESFFNIQDKSITTNGMQQCFEEHQPDVWIFGHYHIRKNEKLDKTRFICLEELETHFL